MTTENLMEEYSRFMLVTIIAVFAFVSSALLNTTVLTVKVVYTISLMCSVLSVNSAFQVMLVRINFSIKLRKSQEDWTSETLPFDLFDAMKNKLQHQFNYSILSLSLLTISISLFFFLPVDIT